MNLSLYILSGAIVWTLGDVLLKQYSVNNKPLFLILGLIVGAGGLFLLSQSFRFKNMASANMMMVTLNAILLFVVSWLFFKEQISLTQLGGIVLSLAGLYLLEVS